MESKIILGDTKIVLKEVADESIDLIVSDIPYKIVAGGCSVVDDGKGTGGILKRRVVTDGSRLGNRWMPKNENQMVSCAKNGTMFTHNNIKFEEWLPDAYRVLKQNSHCYLMINGRNLKELQQKAEDAGFIFQNLLVWDKGNATPNNFYMQSCEFILMLRKGKAKYINNLGCKTLLSVPNMVGKKVHPTEKPVDLLKILVENSSKEGDMVMDMFAGSFSLAEACILTNRKYFCIEIDKDFYEIGLKRVSNKNYRNNQNVEQMGLF